MTPFARLLLRFVGLVSLGCAVFGFWYLYNTVQADYAPLTSKMGLRYFTESYFVMAGICCCCFATLAYCAVSFLRCRFEAFRLFVLLVLVEIGYALCLIILLPAFPRNVALSVGAATGVANGGLVAQAYLLLPLWGPFAVFVARRSAVRHGFSPAA
jgi:hypothetical protein